MLRDRRVLVVTPRTVGIYGTTPQENNQLKDPPSFVEQQTADRDNGLETEHARNTVHRSLYKAILRQSCMIR